jgi:hypothetical protein
MYVLWATSCNNCRLTRCDVGQVISIDALPDDVLLAIFGSYLHEVWDPEERTRAWQSLIHVCRRWRSVVFGSPRRLDLRLFCTNITRSRDRLDIWPALPLIINDTGLFSTDPQMQRSCMLHRARDLREFGLGNIIGSNARAISGADISEALV